MPIPDQFRVGDRVVAILAPLDSESPASAALGIVGEVSNQCVAVTLALAHDHQPVQRFSALNGRAITNPDSFIARV